MVTGLESSLILSLLLLSLGKALPVAMAGPGNVDGPLAVIGALTLLLHNTSDILRAIILMPVKRLWPLRWTVLIKKAITSDSVTFDYWINTHLWTFFVKLVFEYILVISLFRFNWIFLWWCKVFNCRRCFVLFYLYIFFFSENCLYSEI